MLALAAAGWLASGCGGPRPVQTGNGPAAPPEVAPDLVAKVRPPIPDVPVPVGFALDESRSRDFAAAGARYVDHVYHGGDGRFAVARFYRQHMPAARWVLVTSLFVQGDLMLDFEKETERCRVVIKKARMFRQTDVFVQLWTSGQIQTAYAPKAPNRR
jgi:hypothetical protein